MDEKDYIKTIAKLETMNDQLQAEMTRLNYLLKKIGFEEGIKTLKEAAEEIIEKSGGDNPPDPQIEE